MKNLRIIVSIILIGAAPLSVLAQTSFSIEDVGGTIGLGTSDLKETVINILSGYWGY